MTDVTRTHPNDDCTVTLLQPGEHVHLSSEGARYAGVVLAVDERGVRLGSMAVLHDVGGSRSMPGAFIFPWSEIRGIAIPAERHIPESPNDDTARGMIGAP